MKLIAVALFIFSFIISIESYSAKILNVKKNRAIIEFEGDAESVQEGQIFYTLDNNERKIGLIKIVQVKGNKALAIIEKGHAQEGNSLAAQGSKRRGHAKEKKAWGVQIGYLQNSMTVKPAGGSAELKGSSFNFLAFYDMTLDKNIGVKFSSGYHTLSASGQTNSGICDGNTTCNIDLSYLALNTIIRYDFSKNKNLQLWGGAGLGFLYAVSKSSNAIDTSKITTNQNILTAIGIDCKSDLNSYIPIQLTYAMFPNNATATANQLSLAIGYGVNF